MSFVSWPPDQNLITLHSGVERKASGASVTNMFWLKNDWNDKLTVSTSAVNVLFFLILSAVVVFLSFSSHECLFCAPCVTTTNVKQRWNSLGCLHQFSVLGGADASRWGSSVHQPSCCHLYLVLWSSSCFYTKPSHQTIITCCCLLVVEACPLRVCADVGLGANLSHYGLCFSPRPPKGHGKTPKDAASVRATHPIPAACGVYYFEVKIISKGRDGYGHKTPFGW